MKLKTIDLKLGEIKEPLPEGILKQFREKAFVNVNQYPQNYNSLIEKLAKKHAISPENITLINGVDEGIDLIVRVFGDDILIFPPTYFELLEAAKRNSRKITEIDSFDRQKYTLKYNPSDVEKRSLILLCNPNNPFGLIGREELLNLAGQTKGIVAVDETYIDFNGKSVLNDAKDLSNLLVLRSFSKGYSLAGLRIGYIVGDKKLISKIKNIKLYFNVTSVAVNCAKICLEEEDYFNNLVADITRRKEEFEDFLRQKSLPVIKTMNNNIILGFKNEEEANEFNSFLKDNDVIVNQGNGLSTCGLDHTFLRFTCGTKEQMREVKERLRGYK